MIIRKFVSSMYQHFRFRAPAMVNTFLPFLDPRAHALQAEVIGVRRLL